jgi:hypothetical protein
VAKSNRVLSDQDFLDDEAHDPLAFGDTQRISGIAQASEEGCQSLGETQECGPVCDLIGDGLKLGADCTFALAK